MQFEEFIENPIQVLVDIENIDISNLGQDMTNQKEKAQEVVVPVILTRIASMAAFIFRKVNDKEVMVLVCRSYKRALNLSWTLVGLVIATLTLTGSAQQITGLALITLAIWLLTIGFRK